MEESVRPRITKKFWKFKSMTNRGLRVLLIASSLLSLVSAAVNGFRPRRCRRSESTAKLGYGLDLCAIPNPIPSTL